MSLYKALIDFRDNDNDPMWISQEDIEDIIKVKTLIKVNRGKSLLELNFSHEEYVKMFIEDENDYSNNDLLISITLNNRDYYGDYVFIDPYYHGEEEMKQGYIFGHFSEDNLKKLESILKISKPKLSIYREEDKDEIGVFLLDNFNSEASEICSDYSSEFDSALVAGLKDYVINKFCNVLTSFGIIERTCAGSYYTTVNNLIKVWDNSNSDKDGTIIEMLKDLIKQNNLQLDEDLYEDYYNYYDDKYFDQVSFNRNVERNLDKIYENLEEQIESGEFRENMEIINFLDEKGYRFDKFYEFPKEKTFGKKDLSRFKFNDVSDGKVKIIFVKKTGTTRGFSLNFDQLKNFLFHPELFD